MAAPIENEFWKLRKDLSETGKKLTPNEIIEKSQEYVTRCVENPMLETDYRGRDLTLVNLPKMRAMTLEGLFFYLDISKQTWQNWKEDDKYIDIITRVENLFFTYNFEGAAAGMLNPNIIARKLGISDKKEIDIEGNVNLPIKQWAK